MEKIENFDDFKSTIAEHENYEQIMDFVNSKTNSLSTEAKDRRIENQDLKTTNKEQQDMIDKLKETTNTKDIDELIEKWNETNSTVSTIKNELEEEKSSKLKMQLSEEIDRKLKEKSISDDSGLMKDGLLTKVTKDDSGNLKVGEVAIDDFLQNLKDAREISINSKEIDEKNTSDVFLSKEDYLNLPADQRKARKAEFLEFLKTQ